MSGLLFLIICFFGIYILPAIVMGIKESLEKSTLSNVLEDFDCEEEKKDILAINKKYNFIEKGERKTFLEIRKEEMFHKQIEDLIKRHER